MEDWSWEVSRGQRERWRGSVAGRWLLLQRRTGTGWVQTRLGSLNPARDFLEQIPCLLVFLFLRCLLLLHLSQILHAATNRLRRHKEAVNVTLPVWQIKDELRLWVVLRFSLSPGNFIQIRRRAHFVITGAATVNLPVSQTAGTFQRGVRVFQEALRRAAVGIFAWINLYETVGEGKVINFNKQLILVVLTHIPCVQWNLSSWQNKYYRERTKA